MHDPARSWHPPASSKLSDEFASLDLACPWHACCSEYDRTGAEDGHHAASGCIDEGAYSREGLAVSMDRAYGSSEVAEMAVWASNLEDGVPPLAQETRQAGAIRSGVLNAESLDMLGLLPADIEALRQDEVI